MNILFYCKKKLLF